MDMRTLKHWLGIAAAASACTLLSAHAAADGLVLQTSRIPAVERAALRARIDRERVAHPASFRAVRQLSEAAARIDARRHGRFAPLASRFEALGVGALLPMIELIAFETGPRTPLTPNAWTSLCAGLIEAVGRLRDPLSRPVLIAIVDSQPADYQVLRAAAQALGRLGTDADASHLATSARAYGLRRPGLLA